MNEHRLHLVIVCLFCCALLGCPFKDQTPPPPGPPLPPPPLPIYRITGTITGADTIDLSGIVVRIADHPYSATTDAQGRFTIDKVPTGAYTLVPSKHAMYFFPDRLNTEVAGKDTSGHDFTGFAELLALTELPPIPFLMGSTNGQPIETPLRTISLLKFQMSPYEVTQEQWMTVMQTNPSSVKNPSNPVESISWFDAIEFCNRLSQQERLSPAYTVNGTTVTCNFKANGYRLPTEAEWEYSCRAGTTTDRYSGDGMRSGQSCDDEATMNAIGWYCNNADDHPHPVGTKQPNTLGLYDMLGNVSEWCWDWYGSYPIQSSDFPTGPEIGDLRVHRGGSAYDAPIFTRSACRLASVPTGSLRNVGFRVARTLPQ